MYVLEDDPPQAAIETHICNLDTIQRYTGGYDALG